jgi:PAS domain S-box-containing protein
MMAYPERPSASSPAELPLASKPDLAVSEAQRDSERAESLVRAARIDLRATIDMLPTLHWRCLPDGSAEFLNQTWLDYTGYSMEQGCGWGWTSAIHPDDLPAQMKTWTGLLISGQPGEAESRLRRRDGQYRWFLFQARPMRDETGQIVLWCGTSIDIDDRKFADGLLAGENRVLEMIAQGEYLSRILTELCRHADEFSNNAITSIWLLDQSDNLLRLSASANLPAQFSEAIKGIAVAPGDGPCGASVSRREPVIASDIATDPLCVKYRDLGVRHGVRACWSTPILTSANSVLGAFALFVREVATPTSRDWRVIEQVTHLASIAIERSRTETTLQRTRDELAHVTRITTLGELAASIAHEVNQPLSAIGTHGEAGLRWLAHQAPAIEQARKTFNKIISDAGRAGEVLRRIRDLSRKAESEKMPLDINSVIGEVIPLIESEAMSRKATLRLDLSTELPSVLGDRVQLQQVTINLIMNGIEALEAAGHEPRELAIRSGVYENDHVLVAVRDSGVGIDPNNVDRLFQAFFTTKHSGMGMGLSICRSILESHGGRIWAAQNDGPGTTFNFVLPAANRGTA